MADFTALSDSLKIPRPNRMRKQRTGRSRGGRSPETAFPRHSETNKNRVEREVIIRAEPVSYTHLLCPRRNATWWYPGHRSRAM